MYTIENPVGRLITTRMPEPPSLADAKRFAMDLSRAMLPHARTRVLLCSDFRSSGRYTQEVTDFMTDMMRQDNLLIERAGILVSQNSTGLLVFNAIREANAPDRRMAATNPQEVQQYLAGFTTPEEASAVARHLGLAPLR